MIAIGFSAWLQEAWPYTLENTALGLGILFVVGYGLSKLQDFVVDIIRG
jgi:hypothetical protein